MRRVAALAAVLVVAGCASAEAPRERERAASPPPAETDAAGASRAPVETAPAETVAPSQPEPVEKPECAPGGERPAGTKRFALAAFAKGRISAYRTPGGRRIATFARKTSLGFPMLFGVRRIVVDRNCEPTWYRVQLPKRPNGRLGYVRTSAVDVIRIRTRIEVDVSSHRLTLFRDGRPMLRTSVAVGTSKTPTPIGHFYVNQRVRLADPGGPYGPFALGVSAFSPVLTGWAEGGPVAIHGTNDPSSIGRSVSNGCIRVRNNVLRSLYRKTYAGTPVLIRA